MKSISLLWLAILINFPAFAQSTDVKTILFPILEGDRYGFINQKGDLITAPKYRAITAFSEGLVAVQEAGQYGYIDHTGTYVIPPIFDYGTPFQEGKAVAYKDGVAYYINQKGELLFGKNFEELFPFLNGRAMVKTKTEKYGIINTQGHLVIDTLFKRMSTFKDGIAVVDGLEISEEGIIDTMGRFVVPFGRFDRLYQFNEGLAKVEFQDEKKGKFEGLIDTKGKLLFTMHDSLGWLGGNMYNGLARINIIKPRFRHLTNQLIKNKYNSGYINIKGEIVIEDSLYHQSFDFSNNRAIVETKDGDGLIIIDKKGDIISENTYYDSHGHSFQNGLLIVITNKNTGIIDTNANYIFPPIEENIELIRGEYFFFSDWGDKYGIGRLDGTIIIPPILDNFDKGGFKNGLLMAQMNGQLIYMNEAGKIVWKAKKVPTKTGLKTMYIDYMNEVPYYAISKFHKSDLESKNAPRLIDSKPESPKNELSLIFPDEKIIDFHGFKGRRILLINNTSKKQYLNAQDSRLYMCVQAKNSNGEWQDIEYSPSSWCGNSYHIMSLESQYYWEFKMPIYEGAIPTQLRVALSFNSTNAYSDKMTNIIYSPIFEGSINPGQFWRKRPYYPRGLMDSYND